jgi:hypothetical protein
MRITADRPKGILLFDGARFNISNKVRSMKAGTRKSYEVVRSIPDKKPYDPRPFPEGLWHIAGVEWQKDRGFDKWTYGPVKIRTDAWQLVNVWELDADGDYLRETSKTVQDYGYLLHNSVSVTTLGCIRIATPYEAELLGKVIEKALLRKEPVEIEVI